MNVPEPQLIQACHAHLSRTHSTFWGGKFDVREARSREDAVDWLTRQIADVLGWVGPTVEAKP